MKFLALVDAIAGKNPAIHATPQTARADYPLAEIEKQLGGSSDAFFEAVTLLDRSLPRCFSAW